MVNQQQRSTSWALIIFMFIIFWPIGIFLLIRKLDQDRSANMSNGRGIALVSFVLMFFSFVYLMLVFSDGFGYVVPMLLTGVGGFFLFRFSRKMNASSKRYRQYINFIVNQGQTSIDAMTQAMGITYAVATEDLQKMINKGFFQGAYIDQQRRIVVMPAPIQATQQAGQTMPQERIVTCGGCGANNRVFGHVGECEYCGSPIG